MISRFSVRDRIGPMPGPARNTRHFPLIAQIGIGILSLTWLLVAPPPVGAMMLVPLSPAAARALPQAALNGDTRLLGSGTLPGSLVVRGRRAALLGPMFARGVLTLATDERGCDGATRS